MDISKWKKHRVVKTVLATATLLPSRVVCLLFRCLCKVSLHHLLVRTILSLLTFEGNNRVSALFITRFMLMEIDSSR